MRKKEEARSTDYWFFFPIQFFSIFFFAEVEAGMRKQEKQQHEKIRALQASVAALQQEKAQVVKP
jgi:hypothetical protein